MACAHLAPLVGVAALTDTNFGLTLWTVVLFVLFFIVLTKFGWKPLLAMIEERENGIREAVAGAEKARADAQALLVRQRSSSPRSRKRSGSRPTSPRRRARSRRP